MWSKLLVIRASRLLVPPVRYIGMSPLERFEKLRELCCLSETSRRNAEAEDKLRPKAQEFGETNYEECSEGKVQEKMDVRCKTAMILGGASGIGFETADGLLKAGINRVIVADINPCKGVEAVKKLCAAYGNSKAVFLTTDLRQQPSIEAAFKETYKYFRQVDIYINCVGIYNETPQCWDNMVKTNLIGSVRGTILAYKYMSENPDDDCGQGSVIVNVSSYGAISNIPTMPMFSAVSNGINGLTSSFGTDFHYSKTKIRFLCVCPACTDSGLLKNMTVNHYDRSWAAHSSAAIKCCTKQSPKAVGKVIVNAVRYGVNGSIYVIKEGEHFRYTMPDYMKFMRQETILL